MQLGTVDEKALSDLGWAGLCGELALRAHTPMGRERCLALRPEGDSLAAEGRLARIGEARELRRVDREVPLAGALDLRTAVGRAARNGALEPHELLQVARLIETVSAARRFLYSQADRAPLSFALAETLSELDPLARELARAFDPVAKLLDGASPLLGELRDRARGLHRAIKSRLEEMLKDEEVVGMLRDAYYSVRGDRYVLPVRAEHKGHLPGIVHNASGSGQTLFVEPQELLELGNQLTIAEASALEEEQRILGELSAAVGRQAERIARDVETLAILDEAAAGGSLADDLDAIAPALVSPEESFHLPGLRHPLLVLQQRARALGQGKPAGDAVVANDVLLPGNARGLVVSGPNAGGKTVTITAVGLCALMARAGLPLPARSGARMPLYRTVLTAIGDEGDLARDLSTFTAHLAALRQILEARGPGTLVLIDEIASGTDPREGAALAVAALEALVDAGGQVLVTTHLEELKALGLSDARFASASVGFDVDRLAPTYRLRLGEVGASSAIEIARRAGLPQSVCDRAREVLGGGSSALAQAVEQLERERAASAAARSVLEEAARGLERERVLFEKERGALRALEKATRETARAALVADLEEKREEVARVIARLQERPSMSAAVEAQRALEEAREQEERAAAREQTSAAAPAVGPVLAAGSAVRHARLGSEGVVIDVHGSEATVQLGALKTRVRIDDLVPVAGKIHAQRGFRSTRDERLERAHGAREAPIAAALPQVDVRGLRVDEALRALERGLDHYLREGAEEVHVIHGHGGGALKQAVREHLARSPYVSRARPGQSHEGGDGVTVAELRG